ncbi:MAG: Gfo/Idh/MocA family oxidoreductase [Candidatus Solibacter usitatus]|nr:Gfo/Idh/MocA family oxidoreductase [Candidatus Solibacter usitatus]
MNRRDFLTTAAALAANAQAAPNARIQVGVIGCGARAHELMEAIMQNPGTEIVGVVDAYKGRVERAIDRTKQRAKAYASHHDLLADRSIDAVVVATPDHWHKPIILDALAAGKDVYSEKPMTYKASDGREIIRAAQAGGRIVQVGSQGISSQSQRTAKEMIRAGKLGRVTMIRAAYNRNTASGAWIYPIPPDASPKTVNWDMFLGPAPKVPFSLERFFRWRCFEDYSGGIATDLFVHLCTTIHFLMDATMPARVVAMGELYRWKEQREVPDTLNAVLEYPQGFTVNLSCTFNNQSAGEGAFQFHGTEGTISLGFGTLAYTPENVIEDNNWIVESWPKALEDAYYRDPKVIETEVAPARNRKKAETQVFKDSKSDSTIEHFGHFFDSVRSRKPYWEDAVAGHHAAACAHLINLSVKQKKMTEWDFELDDIRA